MTDNERRRQLGWAAVKAGTPDFGMNGPGNEGLATDASDALANIFHLVHDLGIGVQEVIERGLMHFRAEASGEE